MNPATLRSLFNQLSALPHYAPEANTLSPEKAKEIAAKFEEELEDVVQHLQQANQFGAIRQTRPDCHGNGVGLFMNAERLFFGYLYDIHHEGMCDGLAAARHDHQPIDEEW